jgi:tetratricopeptide (TPR) repeat protein
VRNISDTRRYREFGASVSIERLLSPEGWSGFGYGRREFYAGLLVHMLVNRHPAELDCYLRKLETDIDLDAAFTSCFASRARWQSELDDYAYSTFNTRTAPFDPPTLHPRTTTLNDAETHVVLAVLDLMAATPKYRAEHEQRARGNIRRALELDPNQLRAGLLHLDEPDLPPRSFAELTAALVKSHPTDWRVWVARTWAEGISGAEEEQAAEQAFRLAPDEAQVLQLAAIRSLVHGKWEEAHALAHRSWLRGSTTTSIRVVLAIAAGQVGRCAESRSWAPTSSAEKPRFTSELARMQAQLGLKDPCP